MAVREPAVRWSISVVWAGRNAVLSDPARRIPGWFGHPPAKRGRPRLLSTEQADTSGNAANPSSQGNPTETKTATDDTLQVTEAIWEIGILLYQITGTPVMEIIKRDITMPKRTQ